MFIKMIKSKKGVSPIIATILLILISIVAFASIVAFVVPFVKEQLEGSKECFNVPEQISIIDSSEYTCFNNDKIKVGVSVKRSSEEVEIGGFQIAIQGKNSAGEESSVVVEIKEGESVANVQMLNEAGSLVLPKKGEEKTYVITLAAGRTPSPVSSPEKVVIAPISAKGKLCNIADEVEEVPICSQSIKDGGTFLGT